MRLAIDAGHSWITAGKRTPKFSDGTFMHEFDFNSAVANMVVENLKHCCEIVLTYDESGQTDYTYYSRVQKANTVKADLFVSIHANAIGDGVSFNSSYGILFLADERRTDHVDFARTIIGEMAKVYPRKRVLNWIPGSTGQSLCKYSDMPTAIIECGFMTNLQDAELLLDIDYRKNCADAISNGILIYAKQKGLIKMDEGLIRQAEEAIEILALRGFIKDPEVWKNSDLSQPMPVAHTMIILSRIVQDYGGMIDDFDKRRY